MEVKIEASWKAALQEEFDKPYFAAISAFVRREMAEGKMILPPPKLIFNAFEKTPFDRVKVVLLGQDPYPTPGHAHGLCFSVPHGVTIPKSLHNIYKELESDLGLAKPAHGCLEKWAGQGVFMLNTSLTVRARESNSHSKIGWEVFTDAVISKLSSAKTGLVFLLWGRFAQSKQALIDTGKHFVLEAAHPSPLAGDRFLGNRHFSKANELLRQQGLAPIDWQV